MAGVTVVQGFGPFGEFTENPSELLVQGLAKRNEDPGLVTEVLPVEREATVAGIAELMREYRPRVWLGVGLAGGRTALAIEAVAVNLMHWKEIDGVSMSRRPIVEDGPAAYATTLPVDEILAAWQDRGIPGYLSQTAGGYMCNLSFYTAARTAAELGLDCRVGFLHVPLLPGHVTDPERQPSMAMALQEAGLDCVLAACRDAAAG
jgi:pyroglutamyl-peptidase